MILICSTWNSIFHLFNLWCSCHCSFKNSLYQGQRSRVTHKCTYLRVFCNQLINFHSLDDYSFIYLCLFSPYYSVTSEYEKQFILSEQPYHSESYQFSLISETIFFLSTTLIRNYGVGKWHTISSHRHSYCPITKSVSNDVFHTNGCNQKLTLSSV